MVSSATRSSPESRSTRSTRSRASTRGSSTTSSSWSRSKGGCASIEPRRRADDVDPRGEAERVLRPPARRTSGTPTRPRSGATATRRGIVPVFKLVDTCAAEFEAVTPYYYSTYEQEDEARVGDEPRVVILGGGPNRIGQGIEFDYCCCQAAFALKADGYEVVMVNSNPETVSTDYDTSDRLFFEPLTVEDVLNIMRDGEAGRRDRPVRRADAAEPGARPRSGRACRSSARAPRSIDLAEDRERFRVVHRPARPEADAQRLGDDVRRGAADRRARSGIRCSCGRASCWAGGRWRSSTTRRRSRGSSAEAFEASPEHPVLIDKFLEDASEVDVDAVCDGATHARRRRDGAHRGGRHPLGRLGLRHPAVQPVDRDRRAS